jgi:hypothetical protein
MMHLTCAKMPAGKVRENLIVRRDTGSASFLRCAETGLLGKSEHSARTALRSRPDLVWFIKAEYRNYFLPALQDTRRAMPAAFLME